MSVGTDGWLSWVERVPGDTRKLNGWANGMLGIAGHSAEGWETYLRDYNTLHAHYAARRASWMFSNLRNGKMLQHFPVTAQCWTSGAGWPNNNLWSVESEGVVGLPLNEAQTANMARLAGEQKVLTGRNEVQRIGVRTSAPPGVLVIVEHGECTRWGAIPTACPSGRYDWAEILRRVDGEEEDMMRVWDAWGLSDFQVNAGREVAIDARQVFNVPADAKQIEIEFMAQGYGVVKHGSTGTQAGRFGWGQKPGVADGYGHCRVELGDKGEFYLFSEDQSNPISLYTAHVVGVYA